MRRLLLRFLFLALVGCPASSGSPDAASGDIGPVDVGRDDGGDAADVESADSPASDTTIPDAPIDSSIVDAAPDATPADVGADSATPDAEPGDDPCATVGCAFPPVCGEACTAECGCCECEGAGSCGAGVATNCAGSCFVQTPCGDTDCAVDPDTGVAFCGNCRTVRAAYEARIAASARCGAPGECQVLEGHCDVGLGGCYVGAGAGLLQGELDAIAAQWVALGCHLGAPVCDCGPRPDVRCDAGGCLLR